MNIQELVKEASSKSPEFRSKWLYWVVQRNKQPDFEWLMNNLEEALGKSYVRRAAKEEIEGTKTSEEEVQDDKKN